MYIRYFNVEKKPLKKKKSYLTAARLKIQCIEKKQKIKIEKNRFMVEANGVAKCNRTKFAD